MARLLVCRACGTMNRMMDFSGPPEYDTELIETIRRHMERSPRESHPDAHPSQLFSVADDEAALLDMESALVKRLSDEQIFIKEIRDDLKVEAMKCFNNHKRPQQGCIDWHDESKSVSRTQGIPLEHRRFLCDVCPVASYVMFKKRQASGAYN